MTWNMAATVMNLGSVFFTGVVLANILGRAGFGEFVMVQSTVLAISTTAQLAIGYTATKYVAEFRLVNKDKVEKILGLCSSLAGITATTSSIALLGLAPWLARDILLTPSLTTSLRIAAGVVLFTVMNAFQLGVLGGFQNYRAVALASGLGSMLHFTGSCVCGWLWGSEGCFAAMVVSSFLSWLLLRSLTRKSLKQEGISCDYWRAWEEWPVIVRFTLPGALGGLLGMPAVWAVNVLVASTSNGFENLALYSAANTLKGLVLLCPKIMNDVASSLLNHHKGLRNSRDYRAVFWMNIVLTWISASVAALAVGFLGPYLLRMYGRDYNGGYSILVLLLLSSLMEAMAIAVYQVLPSQEKLWLSIVAINLPRDCSIVLLAYCFLPAYGIAGVAVAQLAGWAMTLVIIIVLVTRLGLTLSPLSVPGSTSAT